MINIINPKELPDIISNKQIDLQKIDETNKMINETLKIINDHKKNILNEKKKNYGCFMFNNLI
tara:strand:- start:211 stop:399 length:189 start_codon:yes stop_codon:yes gene_type:complete